MILMAGPLMVNGVAGGIDADRWRCRCGIDFD